MYFKNKNGNNNKMYFILDKKIRLFNRYNLRNILSFFRTLGDIWEEANDDHKFVVVIFEDENSVVGREVCLIS